MSDHRRDRQEQPTPTDRPMRDPVGQVPPLVAQQSVTITVNGVKRSLVADVRTTLVDALREDFELTGTHIGCEHGVCGACTILLDGVAVRSCLLFAVQANGHTITTVEGIGTPEALHPLQEAFRTYHGLQCGFCTPGFLMSALSLLNETPHPSEEEIRAALSGNLCRCTGYQGILEAVRAAAERLPPPKPHSGPHGPR